MIKLFVIFYILALSVSAKASRAIPPHFDLSFISESGTVTTVGQEASFTAYLEELDQDLQSPVVYVADIFNVDRAKVQGKFVLLERDGKSPFGEKIRLMAYNGAVGVIVVNMDESLFMMVGEGGLLEARGLMIPHSIGIQIRDQLLSGQSVQVRIPFVAEKTM